MEDMGNYGYTLFRTIPKKTIICITFWDEVMHIAMKLPGLFFAVYPILKWGERGSLHGRACFNKAPRMDFISQSSLHDAHGARLQRWH